MKKRRLLIAALAVLSLAAGLLLRQERAVDEGSALKELAPTADFRQKSGAPPLYRSASGDVAFNSHDVVPGIRGYAGPISVLIVLGQDGRLKGLKILEHRETRNYVHYLETPAYLNRFIGKSVLDRFEVDRDIDGISRATVSVEALARTVRESSRLVAGQAYGISTAAEPPAQPGKRGWILYAALFAAALSGYAATRRSPRRQRLRDAVLVAAIAVIGFALSASFSILHAFNLILLQPSSSALWIIMVAGTLLSMAFAGRLYCGWLCPFGAASEFLARLPVRKWTLDSRTDDRWRQAKYALLGAATAAVLLFRRTEYGNYETYVTLFSLHGTVLAWILVVLMLAANLRVPRFWCRYLCPVAAFSALLSRKAAGYPSAPSCPMGNKEDPEIGECIRCNRCYHKKKENRSGDLSQRIQRKSGSEHECHEWTNDRNVSKPFSPALSSPFSFPPRGSGSWSMTQFFDVKRGPGKGERGCTLDFSTNARRGIMGP